MGQKSYRRVVILAMLFVITAAFIYIRSDAGPLPKPLNLHQAVDSIAGWRLADNAPLDPKIVDALLLDDYVNNTYAAQQGVVSLYIGYYFTRQKVGAAHDPLVCLPGQGWNVAQRGEGNIALSQGEKQRINYSDMVIERGPNKMLIVYWFQADEATAPDTFRQKLASLMQKFRHGKQDNAFVRVSILTGERSVEESLKIIVDFIEAFYPPFIQYVRS